MDLFDFDHDGIVSFDEEMLGLGIVLAACDELNQEDEDEDELDDLDDLDDDDLDDLDDEFDF